jgi:TonB family protein
MTLSLVSARRLPLLVAGLLVSAAPLAAQSLGQIAAQEAARRKTITAPARVITEDDLGAAPAPFPAEAPAASQPEEVTGRRVAVAPAKYRGGAVPPIPIQAVSAGEVVLEVAVDKNGRVTGVTPLRATAPFTDAMAAAVRTWSFAPAEDAPAPPGGGEPATADRKPVASTVLVIGLFRPPGLFAPTLGEPPKDVAKPSGTAPAPTARLEMPSYPPNALNDGVVLLELDVAAHGGIAGIAVVKSSPAFDKAAVQAASSLTFAPRALVYVVAGFRQPIT